MSDMWTYSGADGNMPPRSGTAPKTVRAGRMRGCGFNMRPAEVQRHLPKNPIKNGEKIPAFATLALKVTGLVPTFADGTQDVPVNKAVEKKHLWSQPTKEATDIYNSLAQDRARELELQIEILKCEIDIARAEQNTKRRGAKKAARGVLNEKQ